MSDRMTDERLDRLREQAILQNGLAFHATQELFDELAKLRAIVARLRDDGLPNRVVFGNDKYPTQIDAYRAAVLGEKENEK